MSARRTTWTRIETETEFRNAFVGRSFVGDGARFTIHADGGLTGEVAGSLLSGTWYWDGGYFCRTATLDGETLGLDCELIEEATDRMRYTRDRGRGSSTIVTIASNRD
jgi:hypothetical protein